MTENDLLVFDTSKGKEPILLQKVLRGQSAEAQPPHQEMKAYIPTESEIDAVILELTDISPENTETLKSYLIEMHQKTHKRFELPDDALLAPGHQQEYLDKLLDDLEDKGIKLEIKPIPGGVPAQYSNNGIITLNPDITDVKDGLQMTQLIGHEYIHWRIDDSHLTDALTLLQIEYLAYVGSCYIDERATSQDMREIFKGILISANFGGCRKQS